MSELTQNVKTAFEQVLGYATSHIIQAPGRVNLIGEHTDYNDGFVLPCAANECQTVVAAAKCGVENTVWFSQASALCTGHVKFEAGARREVKSE